MGFLNDLSSWEIAFVVIVMIAFDAVLLLLFRTWMQGGQYKKSTRIDGKTVIITGANSGIGKETAIDLARRGGKIYIACRDLKRGQNALVEIKMKSGSKKIYFLQLDLASLDSVREFSRRFHELESSLHILINNAGIMACPRVLTKDGFESQLGTNHLGHFLLTNLLLGRLKESAPSRVVIVSSVLHKIGRIKRDDLNSEKSYAKWSVYGQSKLANLLFARELSKRLEGSGVTANSLHPGVINTELGRNLDMVSKFFFNPAKWLVFKTIKSGAQTQIRLAVDPELDEVSGKYFRDCRQSNPSSAARDDETAVWLWKKSEELTHFAAV